MDPWRRRLDTARALRLAADQLLEASEGTHDLNRTQLSSELLDQALELLKIAREFLDMPAQPPAAQEELPF